MKKKTIATSLLAILVSTYAAPFVSNAEAIKGATKETTEQVTPAEEEPAAPAEEEPAAPVTDEAPVVENEEPAAPVADEAPVAEKEDVKAPTTKIAPATKEAPETKMTEQEAIDAYRDSVIAKLYDYQTAGYITPQERAKFESQLLNAKTTQKIKNIESNIEAAAKVDVHEVEAAREAAYAAIDALPDEFLAPGDKDDYKGAVDYFADNYVNAPTGDNSTAIKGIQDKVAEITKKATDTALAIAKDEAKGTLWEYLNDGTIQGTQYWPLLQQIDAAKTPEAVQAIIDGITGENPTNPENTDLENAKAVAKGGLAQWFAEGLLTETEYNNFVSEVEQSTTVDAVNAVLANAQDLVDSRRPVENTTLAEAKQNAKDQLFNWLSYGQINDNQYVNALNAVNNATTVAEVQAVIAGVQSDIDNEVAATLSQIKQDAKDQLFEWFTNGDLTAEDYAFYLSEVIAATDAEGVAATIANAEQQIQQNGLHFDLEAYKDEARGQLVTWVTEGWITEDQYWAYLSLIDVATTPEQVDAALEALLAEIDNADTLENAQNNATDQLITWLSEGKITEAQYYTYLQRVADATTVAEVKAIIAELQAIINGEVEDVTEKPIGTPTNQNNNTNNVLVTLTTTTEGGKKATVTTKDVVKNADSSKATLPKTGEVNQNLTSLGLVSVALGSLVAVLKRKRS